MYDAIVFSRIYYIFLISGLLTVRIIPSTKRWLYYGKILECIDYKGKIKWPISCIMVPKKYFIHFYIISILSTCFWTIGIYFCRFCNKCNWIGYFSNNKTQSLFEVYMCLLFMGLHGIRRFYECLVIEKYSNSQMWIGHYLLGLTYYLFCNISMWCEGGGNLKNLAIRVFDFEDNSVIVVFFSILFYCFFSWMQHSSHITLSKLRIHPNSPKYSLPTSGWFKYITCPHYTAEIGIYFSFVVLTRAQNKTIFLIFIWVILVLTISASQTYTWRLKTFGMHAPHSPWIIFPGIY
ncbi:hypothetical protein T552_00084 [Pneumocystis carinii B80]|uniref:Polyprenal reductase n=1 Tax=Pneumocystis carinii (strain B80) TaxID=1408658 RepID=A0A0W4ZSU4_PNEC8|nr:hypothetical protein T552_00084 [Pneumocystis carinii B80]KTW31442.1 hypothetical protein T552_00084 [Pneumocystis carinii B80]